MNKSFKNYQILFFFFVFFIVIISAHAQDTIFNSIDKKGMKQGWCKKTYPNGTLLYKGHFINNVPAGGLMTRYYEDGIKMSEMMFDKQGKVAYATLYYNDGSIAGKGKFVDQKRDSLWTLYSYYTHTITATENYSFGKKQGLSTKYFESGQISETLEFMNGVEMGDWKQYFSNGQLKTLSFFKEGKLHGSFVSFFTNGTKQLEGKYYLGIKVGEWITYNDKGNEVERMEYINGVPANLEKFEQKEQEKFKLHDSLSKKLKEPSIEDVRMP